jgi:hypothetical protein
MFLAEMAAEGQQAEQAIYEETDKGAKKKAEALA